MLRTLMMLLISFSILNHSMSQITITGDDMPVPGDTVRFSYTFVLDGINYEQTGPGFTWDFSNLTVITQQIDTFVSVSQVPAVYQFFFNNQYIYPHHRATVVQKLPEFTLIPDLEITDVYKFLKNAGDEFREVGYGVTLSGIPIPLQYQQIDTIYRFPLQYGNIDSSLSLIQLSVPDLGYLEVNRFRRNIVDGWGMLTTPFGEFSTLRVKTEIEEYDSIYIDSLGVGVPLERNIIEYKWLGKGFPQPLMQVTVEGLTIVAIYIDSVRTSFLDIPERNLHSFDFSIYPNPCTDYISINYELTHESDVRISIYSMYGSELKRFASAIQEKGSYQRVLYLRENGFKPGIYLVRLSIDNVPYVKRILLN